MLLFLYCWTDGSFRGVPYARSDAMSPFERRAAENSAFPTRVYSFTATHSRRECANSLLRNPDVSVLIHCHAFPT
eukprot:gene540-biopygen5754